MCYFVYILYSRDFDKYYIGHTNDVDQRLVRHNEFDVTNTFTSKYRPWELAASIVIGETRGAAMKVEKHLKALKSKKALAEMVANPSKLVSLVEKLLLQSDPPLKTLTAE